MKSIVFALLNFCLAEKCLSPKDNCGPVFADPGAKMQMEATLYSEPEFKGVATTVKVNGAYGCTNDIPAYMVRSLLSTATTKVVLHYGRDCVGHVLQEFQGGSSLVNTTQACPMSVFIKTHRYGSC